jgi:hypothetical protein
MEIYILTTLVIGLLMLGMAVGVIFQREPLKGSCGGTGADCYCEKNNLPKACEVKDSDLPGDCPIFQDIGGSE